MTAFAKPTRVGPVAHILITSGPTREYLDPVRYLTNASSGRMGAALAQAALELGHQVTVVSGPVQIRYPDDAQVIPVVTTEEMLRACEAVFVSCDGLIGAAAPCDYRVRKVQEHKIHKTGQPLQLELIETPDVVATLGQRKGHRWVVGFALETRDARFQALRKMEQKNCDLMVLNGPEAMNSPDNSVEVLDAQGQVLAQFQGSKLQVARKLLHLVQQKLISES